MSSDTKAEGMSHIESKLDERGAAPTESTSTTGSDGTMIGTIKSYLGLSGEGSTDTANSTTLPDRTREPSLEDRTNENTTATTANASFDGSADTKGAHPENLASTEANKSFESSGTSGHAASENLASTEANESFDAPTKSAGVADPSKDTSLKGTEPTPTGSANEKPATSESAAAEKPTLGAASKGLEHPDAIPTAGGEKLGKKHWGESKVVPDNPKPVEEEAAGVSSKAGQPTSEVEDNTSKNTGGAASGPQGQTAATSSSSAADDAEKEKLTDKIKDKLHIGKK